MQKNKEIFPSGEERRDHTSSQEDVGREGNTCEEDGKKEEIIIEDEGHECMSEDDDMSVDDGDDDLDWASMESACTESEDDGEQDDEQCRNNIRYSI